MFYSARIKLTAWYLLIIMVVSLLFSGFIYNGIDQELNRLEMFQSLREVRMQNIFGDSLPEDMRQQLQAEHDEIQYSRDQLIFTLVTINLGILLVSGGAGYFLAGRTLRPIQEMVDEQKRFISDASHELRTPLTALRSEIEVELRDKNLTFLDAKKLIKSNLEEVISLQKLSDNLLQLTQTKSQKKYFEKVPLSDVIMQAVKQVNPLAKNKEIVIKQHLRNERITGEFGSLTQLFVIILENAIKYSSQKTQIRISTIRLNQNIEITVADQGMGIEEEDLPHLFDRFFRADKARTKGGYGLGLSIAKKIVDEHNGTIEVSSVIKKGTTITLRFPASKNSS